jgi:carbonic anhydrase
MLVDDILERNRAWVRGRNPQPLPPIETKRLAVVGCYDPRLDPLLLPALGLAAGDAFLLRSAGALLLPGSTSMRSLGLAIYMFGVTEVLIVGHAACRMAAFDTAAFIEEFRRRGVAREAFGDESLRSWAGAIASPRQGVLQSVAAVREAPFVPKDVRVAGVVLDEVTGALELIVRPDQPVEGAGATIATSGSATVAPPRTSAEMPSRPGAGATPPPPTSAAPAVASAARPSVPPPPPSPTTGKLTKARDRAARAMSAPLPAPAAPARGAAAAAAGGSRVAQTRAMLKAVEDFLTIIESKESWRADLSNLRDELERCHDPRQRLELLDAFARRLSGESRLVAEAFGRLRQEITAAGADPTAELLSVFQYLGGRQ